MGLENQVCYNGGAQGSKCKHKKYFRGNIPATIDPMANYNREYCGPHTAYFLFLEEREVMWFGSILVAIRPLRYYNYCKIIAYKPVLFGSKIKKHFRGTTEATILPLGEYRGPHTLQCTYNHII